MFYACCNHRTIDNSYGKVCEAEKVLVGNVLHAISNYKTYPMLHENEVIFKCVRQNVASAIDEARVSHFAVHFRKYRIFHVNEIVFKCVRQNQKY